MITKKDFKKICEMQIETQTAYCCLCGRLIKKKDEYNIEHLQPVSRGGVNDVSNWRIAHKKTCNERKGALQYEEYLLYLVLDRVRNGQKNERDMEILRGLQPLIQSVKFRECLEYEVKKKNMRRQK